MKIYLSTVKDGNLYPEVFNYLNCLPEQVIQHHNTYGLRHPLGIYNVSIGRVMRAFKAVLDEVDKIRNALVNADGWVNQPLTNLPKLQEELLSSQLAHIDDCYQILKALHPPVSLPKPIPFADKWLIEAKHPSVKEFQKAIVDYRKSFAPIVNTIKHQHGRLRSMMFYPVNRGIVEYHLESRIKFEPRNERIVGYYLEGMQSDGCLGPDTVVHPGNTAISLNRDLRYHFVQLYMVGFHLKNAVVKAIRKQYNLNLPLPKPIKLKPEINEIERIAERVSKLSPLFFPDEFHKPTPSAVYQYSKQGADLTLELPSSSRVVWHGDMMIHGELHLEDGITMTHRLPYFETKTS